MIDVNSICRVCGKPIEVDFERPETEKLWRTYQELRQNLEVNDDAYIPTNFIWSCPKCLEISVKNIQSVLEGIQNIHKRVYKEDKK